MQVIKLNRRGITPANAAAKTAANGARYYAVSHGERGRGRWEITLPLAAREFPYQEGQDSLSLEGMELKLVPLRKQDAQGNELFLLARGEPDGQQLVLWSLSPGYRGGATYQISGQAKVLAMGEEAQGLAGRMGGAPCPVVLVSGPCRLTWTRTGRLYGDPADWVAEYDGATWTVAPVERCAIEDAALNY